MAAGQWNTKIDRGATWRRTLRYTDSAGAAIPLAAPAFMDIRVKPDEDAVLVTRLDSTGNAPGRILVAGNVLSLSIPDDVTALLAPGSYYFDLFVTLALSGDLVRLAGGVVKVVGNVSVPSV